MPPGRPEPSFARVAALAAAGALAAAAAPGQGFYVEGGASLARGDYVYTQATNSGGAAIGLAWTGGPLTLRATLPYFARDARLLAERGVAPPDDVPPPVDAGTFEGSVSDPVLQAALLVRRTARSAVGLSLSVKVPVVEAGAFGTGEWDVGAGLSLSRFVGGATMLGVDATWWHMGDLPELPLRDSVMGTLSVGRSLGRSWLASASLSGGRSTVAGYPDPWWVSALLSRTFSSGILGVTASVGLTDSTADVSLGIVWRLRVGGRPAGASGTPRSATGSSRPPAPGS
jgi:hypothetical protein